MNTKISATILGHVSIQEMLKSTSNSRYSNEVGNVKNSWQLTSMAVFSVPLQVCRSSNMCRLISLCLTLTIAKSLQSCPTLCNPIDGSPPGSPIPGILQARTLEWVAISFSNAWTWKVKVKSLSRVRLFATPWTAAYQAPLSMGFSRQEYCSGVPLPSPTLTITQLLFWVLLIF